MMQRMPKSANAQTACSRLEPQPKLRPATRISALSKGALDNIKGSPPDDERRHSSSGEEPFILSRAPFDKAEILVAGRNFGCGSSREQAVWALADFGIRCVIAPSFGEIFYGNCFRNGVLPIMLSEPEHRDVLAAAETGEPL